MKMTNIKFNFSSEIVLVIGGSRGIGREVCKQFLDAGAHVYSAARTKSNIQGVEDIICDLSNEADIIKLFQSIDKIDFTINVAGTNLCEKIEMISSTEWDRLLDINLKSYFLSCKYSVEKMKKNGGGRIVNVSSIAGKNKSLVSGVHYTSSKYGVIGLTKQLANEVSKYNILVNCVCPSQTMTEMLKESMRQDQISNLESIIPIGRIAQTYEQALPILFLCSEGSSYISGASLDVNGGQL